ncbi:MAG TPA: histidine phosphatase family protein [Candidatus Saccharimonadia bacterium]|nr:histidine phosphatase family protein [Candidatus Saccharimonadia bacterium]
MVTIIFEAHSTSLDNEAELSSGWNDVDLSEAGLRQSSELGTRYKDRLPDAVFCSDLQRSYKTAAIAFKDRLVPIFIDSRLRECGYGKLTQAPKSEVEAKKAEHISKPFPDGESYEQTSRRVAKFLEDLRVSYQNKTVVIIGHRATQYGFEEHLLGKKLEDIISEPWKWQPGWVYSA